MKYMNWVVKAELRGNYKVFVEFNDWLNGVIDFKEKPECCLSVNGSDD